MRLYSHWPILMGLGFLKFNFQAFQFQLEQMKIAFAIAQALNRVLIMPPVLCGLDRAWFPHYGRFPGSRFELPFVCPLDHVVDLEKSDASKFREATFLTHPEIPEEVKRSVAIVENDLMEGSFGDAPTCHFTIKKWESMAGPRFGK